MQGAVMATPYPGFRQHLRERLMRDAVDRKIEERRKANEQQKAVGDADRKASKQGVKPHHGNDGQPQEV